MPHDTAVPLSDQTPWEPLARGSELIFTGSVVAVGPAPPYWSGFFVSYQEVCYQLDERIKGDFPDDRVVVRHVLVSGSPTAQPGEVPGLAAGLFASGARLVVSASADGQGGWVSRSECYSAMPYSSELVERVRTIARALP